MGPSVREIARLYASRLAGTPLSLPPLRIQYVDYAAWQRDWLRGNHFERQLAYWRTALADLPVLNLPSDIPRPPVPGNEGANQAVHIPPSVVAKLRVLGNHESATVFMTLVAAWQAVLAAWTGQSTVALGTPVAN